MAYPCLDASEGRPHLGGALGAELASALVERGWVEPQPGSRTAVVTPAGKRALRAAAGSGGAVVAGRLMTEGLTRAAVATLLADAESVLALNWTGTSTVPSRRQYPHQWGWDAAYIAFGWAWIDQARAAQELESILRGQWADGRVPHIVFHPGVPEDAYFPGPAFWRSADAPDGPDGAITSGLTQPPLHARAALEVALHARDADRADAFLRRVFPRLAAQHAYLARRRDAGGCGPGGDRAPVGVRPGRQPVLGRAAAGGRAAARGRGAVRAARPRARRSQRAPERRVVRPLRAPRAGVPRRRVRRRRPQPVPGRGPAVQRDLAVVHARAGRDRRADRGGRRPVPRGGGGHPRRADEPPVGSPSAAASSPATCTAAGSSTGARSARSRRCSIPTCPRTSRARWPTRSPRRTSARPPGSASRPTTCWPRTSTRAATGAARCGRT